MKQDGKLTLNDIDAVLAEIKKPPANEPTGAARFREYFPPGYSPKQMDAVIIELLTGWKARAAG
jgi:hypothetical protein